MLADAVQELAVLGSYGLQLRFEAICGKCADVVGKVYLFHVQLVLDDLAVVLSQLVGSLYIHLGNGLTVLDVRGVTARTAHHNDLQNLVHIALQLFVDPCLVYSREVAQMDALGSVLVDASYQILVNFFCHEGYHGRCRLGNSYQGGIQGHISIDLILLHALCPETLTAAAYIPVGHIVHELLKGSCCLRDPVIVQVIVDLAYYGVQLGQKPFVHDTQGIIIQLILRCVKFVNVGIQHEERIGVPKGTHEFTLSFLYGLSVETVGQPGRAVDVEIPADGVCAVFIQRVEGIHRISLGLTHLLAVLILYMSQNDNVLIRRLIEQKSGLCQQGIEPASGLVYGL